MLKFYEYKGKRFAQEHGNPFDRGSADSWYSRGRDPHCWPEGSYNGTRVEAQDMTAEQVEAYHAGYDYNEQFGDKKSWN